MGMAYFFEWGFIIWIRAYAYVHQEAAFVFVCAY